MVLRPFKVNREVSYLMKVKTKQPKYGSEDCYSTQPVPEDDDDDDEGDHDDIKENVHSDDDGGDDDNDVDWDNVVDDKHANVVYDIHANGI